jgi:hypothetical protein
MITQDIVIRSNPQFPITHRSPLVHPIDDTLESCGEDREVLVLERKGIEGVDFCVGVENAEIDGERVGGGVGGRRVEEEC